MSKEGRDPSTVPTTPPPRAERRASSLVLVATGDGKGKTTAAMGTALRALARGWKVCVIQFVKSGAWHSGEQRLLTELGATWHTLGDGFTWDAEDLEHSAAIANEAWALARSALSSGEYQLVVLDEITYPLNWGWLDVTAAAEAIASRAERTNVFLTGRDAPEAIVAVADTVTEMRNVKHAFEAGIRAAKGIDY